MSAAAGGPSGCLQSSEDAGGVPRNLRLRTQAGSEESLWVSTEPGECAWSQAVARGRGRTVGSSCIIPRIPVEIEGSAEFKDSGGSRRVLVELRGGSRS
jgi:hypothetical protein